MPALSHIQTYPHGLKCGKTLLMCNPMSPSFPPLSNPKYPNSSSNIFKSKGIGKNTLSGHLVNKTKNMAMESIKKPQFNTCG